MAAFESRLITGWHQRSAASSLLEADHLPTHITLDRSQMTVNLRDKALQITIELLARHAAEHRMHPGQQVIHVRVLRWGAQQTADRVQGGVLRVLRQLGSHIEQIHCQCGLLGRAPVFELGEVRQSLEYKRERGRAIRGALEPGQDQLLDGSDVFLVQALWEDRPAREHAAGVD